MTDIPEWLPWQMALMGGMYSTPYAHKWVEIRRPPNPDTQIVDPATLPGDFNVHGLEWRPHKVLPGTDTLDRERIETLADEILFRVHFNFERGPASRDRVYEALNALAFVTALIIKGADRNEALEWFSDALNTSLK